MLKFRYSLIARSHGCDRLDEVQRRIGVKFSDPSILSRALTHQSYANEGTDGRGRQDSYERLEFLGDAVLNVSVARRLFDAMPEANEGTLTLGRSHVVCRDSLASVSRDLGLGQWISFGRGESGVDVRDSVLEDVYESVLGAVYVDQGAIAAEHFITQTLGDAIRDVIVNGVEKNPKSQFQEVVQAYGLPTPRYSTRLVSADGEYPVIFESRLHVSEFHVARARSNGKTRAEMVAAQEGLLVFSKGIPFALKDMARTETKTNGRFVRVEYSRRKLPLPKGQTRSEPVSSHGLLRRLWLRLSAALQPARTAGLR